MSSFCFGQLTRKVSLTCPGLKQCDYLEGFFQYGIAKAVKGRDLESRSLQILPLAQGDIQQHSTSPQKALSSLEVVKLKIILFMAVQELVGHQLLLEVNIIYLNLFHFKRKTIKDPSYAFKTTIQTKAVPSLTNDTFERGIAQHIAGGHLGHNVQCHKSHVQLFKDDLQCAFLEGTPRLFLLLLLLLLLCRLLLMDSEIAN